MKQYYVYILTNFTNNVLYTGVTGDLLRRTHEHKSKSHKGFTQKYNVTKLVYFETHYDSREAIKREKQIKNLVRRKKIALIQQDNPEWKDLYENIV